MMMLIWSACSEPAVPDTPVAACAGPYQGAFTGDYEGEVSAELDEDGLLVVSFETDDGTLVAAGGVEEDGSLTGTAPGIEVEGQFDFGPCEAQGTWLVEERAGTWELLPQ